MFFPHSDQSLGVKPGDFEKIMDYYQRIENFNEKFLPIELVALIEKFYPSAENSFFSNGKQN